MASADPRDALSKPVTVDARDRQPPELSVRPLILSVVAGPAKGGRWSTAGARTSIGSHPSNHIVIDDPTVSRFHCEVVCDARGARVHDLGSRNGTSVNGVGVIEAFLHDGNTLELGDTRLAAAVAGAALLRLPLSERTRLGNLCGASPSMRALFALLERAAASESTVLLEGETGTGKGEAARAIHDTGARAGRPLVVVDCGAIAEELIESELFGHERGAFTGAVERRLGAFEQANGGTMFLDEIGELPANLQPKLLRALEDREIRRVGGTSRAIDVRVIAATNRDLRAEVNAGRFRSDLYYRLAVITATLPPLRQRPEDIPALINELLGRLGAPADLREAFAAPSLSARLARDAWPGNVRELRNYLERCVVYEQALPLSDVEPAIPEPPARVPGPPAAMAPGARLPFAQARAAAMATFERAYLEELMAEQGNKASKAAAAAGIGRVYLYKLLVRHGLK